MLNRLQLILYISFFCGAMFNSFAQVRCNDELISDCEIDTSYQVYDYFNQRTDSLFCEYGRTILMDCIPYVFEDKKPVYISRKTTNENGSGKLDIFVDNQRLFSYEMREGKIEGTGRIYNPKSGDIEYQGEFKNNVLNGLLFCLSTKNIGVVHTMLFQKGKPVKILYVWNIRQTKKVYRDINRRKYFKNGKSTSIVSYPFE